MHASNDDEFNAELSKLNALAQAEVDAQNRQGLEVFAGLSPMQMQAMLYRPFDSPEVLRVPDTVSDADAPVLNLFLLLAERIGEKGVKLTATGNLPRNLCRELAQIYMGEAGYLKYTKYGGINKETDFYDLHIVRLVAQLGKLTRKYHGKILLTNKAKKLLAKEQHGELYMCLFQHFAVEYNWGYWDAYPELRIIQMAFAYHIYIWQRMGRAAVVSYELVGHFLDAFPMAIDEVMESESDYDRADPAACVEKCYNIRVLVRFGKFLGLLALEPIKDEARPYLTNYYEVTATPLTHQVVEFK